MTPNIITIKFHTRLGHDTEPQQVQFEIRLD